MTLSSFRIPRMVFSKSASLLLPLLVALPAMRAQQKAAPSPADAAKPKIRAITAFINLDRAQFQQQIADTLKMLRRAETTLESRGYTVETIR